MCALRRLAGVLGVASLSLPQGFAAATKGCIEHCEMLAQGIRSAASRDSLQTVVHRLDELSNNACSLVDLAECVARVHPSATCRFSARSSADTILDFINGLNADRKIYDSLAACLEADGTCAFLTPEARNVGHALKHDFEGSGIHLSLGERSRFVCLQAQIHRAALEFEREASSPREGLDRLYSLVSLRHDLATLLGYGSYAAMHLHDKVLSAPSHVENFLAHQSLPRKKPSTAQCENAPCSPSSGALDELSVDRSLAYLQYICRRDFACDFDYALAPGLWSPQIYRLSFCGSGHVYIDFSASPHGPQTACHFTIRTWRALPSRNVVYASDGAQTPIVLIAVPTKDPTGLSFSELQSLFHEFGHAFHTISSRTDLHHLSGTRCSLEFAEVPSSLFELVVQNVDRFAQFGFSGPLVEAHRNWVRKSRVLAEREQRQGILLSRFDQLVHNLPLLHDQRQKRSAGDLASTIKSWAAEHAGDSHLQHSFHDQIPHFKHLVVYGAAYYGYLLSREVAQQIWERYYLADSPQKTAMLSQFIMPSASAATAERRDLLSRLGVVL